MGAILLGSANGSPPDLGIGISIPIPGELPVDPVVLLESPQICDPCTGGGGTIDPSVLDDYYTKDETDALLAGLEGTPMYVHLAVTGQPEGDISLSDVTDWNVDKAIIKMIRVETISTNWDLYLLQNNNGYAADDAEIPALRLMKRGKGDEDIIIDLAYEDEDASKSVHLYFIDNTGSATVSFYIAGFKVQ